MPITFSSDRFSVSYLIGDAKGSSFDNPYGFEDIYQFDQLSGFGYVTKIANTYIFSKSILLFGNSTYFLDGGKNITFYNLPKGDTILNINSCNTRLGTDNPINNSRSYNLSISGQKMLGYQIYVIGSNIEFRNSLFQFVRFRQLNGADGGNIKIYNCIIDGDSTTFDAGFGYGSIELNYLTFSGATLVNNNLTLPIFDNCIFKNQSSLYTQLPGTSTNRKLKFLDSSFINLTMNSYANGETHNKFLIDCNSNIIVNGYTNSSIAYTAFYNVFFQTTLKISLNEQGNIKIYDTDDNLVKQYNAVSYVDDVLTYKSVECYSPALSSQVTKTTSVKQPFRLDFEPISREYQGGLISNFTVAEEVESVIKFDFKPNPAPLTFSITRLLSRIFNSGKKITSQELITEGAIEHEAALEEEAIISNAARATYRPESNDILIEQQVEGAWEEAEVISEGVELVRGSSSVVEDPEAVIIEQTVSASVVEELATAKIIQETLKVKIYET